MPNYNYSTEKKGQKHENQDRSHYLNHSRSQSDDKKSNKQKKCDSEEKYSKEKKGGDNNFDPKQHASSSSTSYDERKFEKFLDKKRLEKFEKEQEEKRRLKELETPEEKRARRLAKKLQKEELRKAQAQSAFPEEIPYTDLNNPFNDTSLTETFVWKKKWETEGKGDISRKKVEKINRETIAKNYAEMEQLKRNREAREAAREDMEMIARDQDRRLCDWNRQEDVFHLKQAKLRSSIRIREGRGKPIDYLGRYIAYFEEENQEEFELDNPMVYLPEDSIDDFEDLIADIRIYRVIDGQKNKNFWDDIETIAKNGLKKLVENRRRDNVTIQPSVQEGFFKIVKGKSYDELGQLENQIQSKIKNGKGTDVSFWESFLDYLRPFMAKQRLKELHASMTQLRLKKMREQQLSEMGIVEHENGSEKRMEIDDDDEQIQTEQPTTSGKFQSSTDTPNAENNQKEKELKTNVPHFSTLNLMQQQKEHLQISITLPFSVDALLKMDDEQRETAYQQLNARGLLEEFAYSSYEHGGYSPAYGREDQTMPGIEILDEIEDCEKLQKLRSKFNNGDGDEETNNQRMMDIAKKGMTNDEVQFSVEETLEKQEFLWSDKYRPRKPRYFNRVHTGFDWNKYNQTHYDIDNPPPKIVQGYRFNIFYPDLLDQTHTPKFTLSKCDDLDFAILRFRAGPPYEDIAFKIVNREWEISYKHGYKCQFQNGVFQLWFFFKRYRYRR